MSAFDDEVMHLADLSHDGDPRRVAHGDALRAAAADVDLTLTLGVNEWGTVLVALMMARTGERPSAEGMRLFAELWEKIKLPVEERVEQIGADLKNSRS
jgi:hypothetical protein